MVVPPSWYLEAYEAALDAACGQCRIDQSIQTNGVLLTRAWLTHLRKSRMRIGVSLDGPSHIHDHHRRTRSGQGTHAAVMRGIEVLRSADVPFHVIAVVTNKALEDPDGFCSFFETVGMTSIGLNFEEIEGVNKTSSLFDLDNASDLRKFLQVILDRSFDNPRLRLREMRQMTAMLRDPHFNKRVNNDENKPFAIVSVDTKGNLSTFSPELLGQSDRISDGYCYGNVHRSSLTDVLNNPDFLQVSTNIAIGVSECQRTCDYFRLCRGGAPANKAAEHGDLRVTETHHCRTSIKIFGELALSQLERELKSASSM